MLIKQKTTLEEDSILINFINQYSKEIDIVLNICRLLLNKNKDIDTFLTQFTLIENKIILEVYIVGHNNKSNIAIPDEIKVIKILKNMGLIIKTDEFTNTLESKVIITLYIDKLEKNKHKQDINDIETYLKLCDLYMPISLHI